MFFLHAVSAVQWPNPNRTNVQRVLYLCATLSPLANIQWHYPFTIGLYGPFNQRIAYALEDLLVAGYVSITKRGGQHMSTSGSQYTITEPGIKNVELVTMLSRERERLEWITLVTKVLDIYGPAVVNKMVYQEPVFQEMLAQNRHGLVDSEVATYTSIDLINTLAARLQAKYDVLITGNEACLVTFFDYLSSNIAEVLPYG
jgi:uncharacterized protein YwgA